MVDIKIRWKTLAGNYWAFGDQWAGISPRGKRFVVKTKKAAISKAGKSTGATKKKPKSTSKTKRSGKTTTKKKGGGGKKTFGQFGTTGLLSAGILYGCAKFVARKYFPQAGAYTGAVSAIAAGGTAKALNLSGKSLFGFGLVELVSELLTDIILPGGLVTAPWVGATQNNRGWQF